VVLPADFRAAVRRGRRVAKPSAVYHRLATDPDAPLRFGVIVSKAVGNAVDRNRARRRLKALGRSYVDAGRRGEDVVIRVLPGDAQSSWDILSADMHSALESSSAPSAVR